MIIFRLLFDCFCILLLWNWLLITSSWNEVLYVSWAMVRFCVLFDFLYLIEIWVPWLYDKFYSWMVSLFPIKKKWFDE
jgi:hypothetical protein